MYIFDYACVGILTFNVRQQLLQTFGVDGGYPKRSGSARWQHLKLKCFTRTYTNTSTHAQNHSSRTFVCFFLLLLFLLLLACLTRLVHFVIAFVTLEHFVAFALFYASREHETQNIVLINPHTKNQIPKRLFVRSLPVSLPFVRLQAADASVASKRKWLNDVKEKMKD